MKFFTKSNLCCNLFYISVVILFLLLPYMNETYGQKNTENSETNSSTVNSVIPSLGEHKFMPNSLVKDPFIKTYIRNSVGVGQALNLDVPVVIIDGQEIFGLRGDLVFASFDFEYHHAVKNWLAVWGKFNVIARLGNDTQALLTQGITAVSGFEFGWLFKLMEKEQTALSLSLSLENGNATIINLLDYINNIIDGDYSSNNSLVNKVQSLRGGSGLRFAWAASKLFGLYAMGELLYGQSAEVRGESEFFYNLGVVFDFDLSTFSDLPLGILLGYNQSNLQSSGISNTFFFRIGYNSPSDLSIGIESSLNKVPVKSLDKTLNAGLTKIMLRYYFE